MNKAELVFKAIDVFGHAPQNAKSFQGITCIKDISYGTEALQKGDLYFKDGINKDEAKKPIVLYIHGGGFIKGDKKHRVTVSEYYANEECYVFSINYRLPPEVDIFGQISDCVTALNYIKTLAESYNIDLDNIFITGRVLCDDPEGFSGLEIGMYPATGGEEIKRCRLPEGNQLYCHMTEDATWFSKNLFEYIDHPYPEKPEWNTNTTAGIYKLDYKTKQVYEFNADGSYKILPWILP